MVHVALMDYKNDEALSVPASLVQQDVEGNDFIYTSVVSKVPRALR